MVYFYDILSAGGMPTYRLSGLVLTRVYVSTKEDIYFITGLLRRGVDFLSFPEVLVGSEAGIQLVYSQRYISTDILSLEISYVFLHLVVRR